MTRRTPHPRTPAGPLDARTTSSLRATVSPALTVTDTAHAVTFGSLMHHRDRSSVKHFFPRGTLPGSDRSDVFDGREHGNVPVSMFLVHNRPGDGPELHRHPYAEVFVVHAGQARFQLEDTSVTAGPGDVVIAPAGAAHRFTNAGAGELSMTCIHTASEMQTEWL